jgi:hypothetical protein
MTMGLSLQDLNDRNAVFAELHRTYGQKRKWTAGELTYTVPSRVWLNGVKYAIPDAFSVSMKPKTTDNDLCDVYIHGKDTNTNGDVVTHVGTIKNH